MSIRAGQPLNVCLAFVLIYTQLCATTAAIAFKLNKDRVPATGHIFFGHIKLSHINAYVNCLYAVAIFAFGTLKHHDLVVVHIARVSTVRAS